MQSSSRVPFRFALALSNTPHHIGVNSRMLRFANDIILSDTTLDPKRHGSSNRSQRGIGGQPAILSHHVFGHRRTNTVRYCASPSAFHAVPGGTRDKQATQANGGRAFYFLRRLILTQWPIRRPKEP